MKPFAELGKDGRVIEWRNHPLSAAMRARGLDVLSLEPVVRPKEDFHDTLLEFRGDERGVWWSWPKERANWDHVLITASDGDTRYKIRSSAASPYVSWQEMNYCESMELTPFRRVGEGGVTVRVERPVTIAADEIDFQHDRGRVRVKLPSHTGTRGLLVLLLMASVDDFIRVGRPIEFNEAGLAVVPLSQLKILGFGVIAVVRRATERQLLLSYRAYSTDLNGLGNLKDRLVDADERARIRRAIEARENSNATAVKSGLAAWLEQWPTKSQQRLRAVYQRALERMTPGAAAQSLRNSPTGLVRHLILELYNFSPSGWLDQHIQQLNDETFEESLAHFSAALPSLIKTVPGAAEQEWVMSHATHPSLSEVVGWVGGRGEAALDGAFSLLEVRAQALNLRSQLRPDSAAGRELAKLVAEIERAPGEAGSDHAQFRHRLDELKQRMREDEQRPIEADGEAPATEIRFQAWLMAREKVLLWRRELAQVVGYCETGRLELPDAAPAAESIEQRLQRIEKPYAPASPSSHVPEDAEGEEVKRLARKLLAEAGTETRETLRRLARAQLQNVILPYAVGWGGLHRRINEARKLASTYPWFAASAGITKPQAKFSDQARAAESLLQLVAAVEQAAGAWAVKSQHLKRAAANRPELARILSTPDHPWPRSAYECCAELFRVLSPSSLLQGVQLPAGAPLPPQELSRQTLNAWWQGLRDLDGLTARLEWGKKRFESSVKSVREDLLPSLRECVAGWKRYAPEERPAYFDELAGLYENCFGEAGVITPSNLEALMGFLNRTAWRRDYEIARRAVSNKI